ncbi:hypothetical protein SCFA_40001 [anaerobic digester metagenome]|uniref:Uncharacterized protein n=1 Tax=anaerobic digester metagenome TaxID=1263854 RepID=A0A485M0C1_9ZZZZ
MLTGDVKRRLLAQKHILLRAFGSGGVLVSRWSQTLIKPAPQRREPAMLDMPPPACDSEISR